jgi:4-hydroxy-tetrahydrodipicolinate synthase
MTAAIRGVFCAAATPVNADLSPDLGAFAAHCAALLADGCDGIALLGTTGEANSFSSAERQAILESALATGMAPDRLMPGTGLANVPETVALTRHALSCGVTTVVMLPPIYY